MRAITWMLVAVLIVLHQDNWNWHDDRLVGGFMPVALLYHMGISLAAAVVWYLATVFCWPVEAPDQTHLSSRSK